MKTLLGLSPCPESRDFTLEWLKADKIVSLVDPLIEFLPEIFRVPQSAFEANEPFKSPIILQNHHITHLFTKLNAGVVAVQNYTGKQLLNPLEAIAYYANTVIPKALGNNFLIDLLVKDFKDAQDGLYVITDFIDLKDQLKQKLNNKFVTLCVTSESTDVNSVTYDYTFVFKSKSALKRELITLTTKLRGN